MRRSTSKPGRAGTLQEKLDHYTVWTYDQYLAKMLALHAAGSPGLARSRAAEQPVQHVVAGAAAVLAVVSAAAWDFSTARPACRFAC